MKWMPSLALAFAFVATGCGHDNKAIMTEDDIAVIAIALDHFRESDAEVETISHDEVAYSNRTQIVVASLTDTNMLDFISEGTLNSFTRRAGEQIRPKLPTQLARNLRGRNTHAVAVADIQQHVPDVKIVLEDELGGRFADPFPDARAWVVLWLPGYNSARDTAILSFLFGPRHHPTQALYTLKKTDRGWEIEWHEFNYYL